MKIIPLFIALLIIPVSTFAATSIPFTVNMSEAVNVTGTPRVAVDVGGVTRYATYTSGTGTSALVFTYTATAGDIDLDGVTLSSPIDLNGGTLKDLAGNDATPSFTIPDTSNVKINYPSLTMDFAYDSDGRYILNGTVYNSLPSFLSAAGGTFTRPSIGTYFDSSGILQTAASGSPRFDYDPVTHAAKGILIEETKTNLATYSIGNGPSWLTSGTLTASSGIAPDGTNSASLFSAASGLHFYRQPISVAASTSYTFSFWAKRGTMTGMSYSIYNFTHGSDIVAPTSYYSSTSAGAWSRITVTFTTPAGCTSIGIYPLRDGGTAGTAYIWGAQLELGTFATSYIPTTASAVTRSSDNLTIPTGTWYNQSAGTFYNDIAWESSTAVLTYPMFFRVDDTTATNRWNLFLKRIPSQLGVDAYNSAVGQGAWLIATGISGSMRVAGAQASNNANVAFGGVLQTNDTSWTPPTVTQLKFYGEPANKWFKTLKYYPLRATNAQLQLLSQ